MTLSTEKSRRGAGRVAFLALRHQVEEMLGAGHDVVAIYDRFSGRLPIGYKQFAKYVQRFSDNHKVRPYGWAPRLLGDRPPAPVVPPTTSLKPAPPTLYPAPSSELIETAPRIVRDEDLF